MKLRPFVVSCLVTCILLLGFGLFVGAHAETPARVLLLPFTIHADKDLDYLKAGIEAMLSSRLSVHNSVEILKKDALPQSGAVLPPTIDHATAISMAQKAHADYVAFGSIIVLGGQHSIDAFFLDVRRQEAQVVFSRTGESIDAVIAQINQFAAEINAKVFGYTAQVPAASAASTQSAESRQHPEKLLAQSQGEGGFLFGLQPSLQTTPLGVWRSQKFKTVINGFDSGDVDNDGRNELVFIDDDRVYIYRIEDRRLIKIDTVEKLDAGRMIGVDVVDINDNGSAEIFITLYFEAAKSLSTEAKKDVRSFVLEWDGARFAVLKKELNWFFRALSIPGLQRKVLLGQKKGNADIYGNSGVHELDWNNGRYEPVRKLTLPRWVNVHGFTYGDVLNNDTEMLLAFSEDDYLRLADFGGDIEWESTDHYGGSHLYFTVPGPFGPKSYDKLYVKQRIHLADLEGNGEHVFFVVRNQDAGGRKFSRTRIFKNGLIEALAWNNIGLVPLWRTQKIPGHISDYTVADVTNNGRKELVAAVVQKGSLMGKDRSYFVFWVQQD